MIIKRGHPFKIKHDDWIKRPPSKYLNSIGASGSLEPTIIERCVRQFVVFSSVRRALKVVVELVVNLGLVKGELGGIVNVNNLFAECVPVVALSFHQFEAGLFGSVFDRRIASVLHATGKSDQTSVFGATVHRIHTIYFVKYNDYRDCSNSRSRIAE